MSELAPGSTFAGYRIEGVVGRGGMGVVYRASDLSLERPVALKLIAPELASDERFRERFLRESRLAASLDHASVVPIYEAGEHEGQLYLAMRYVEGTDLDDLLDHEGTLAPERALRICAQVADALDAAHEKVLVHRDVKPGNVLLDEREHAYLTDFGITKRLAGGETATVTGQIVGTLDYLAPEQIRGEEVDARTDEYALACLLYACLSGQPPFHRETEAETLWAHMQDSPPALSDHPELDPVFRKALAKEKEARYETCAELVAAARAALGLETLARPRRPLRRVLVRRWRWIAAAGALLLAGGIAGLAVALTGGGEKAEPIGTALASIDAQEGRVARLTEFEAPPSNVAVGEGAVWVLNTEDETVSRVDAESGRIVKTFTTGNVPSDIAAGSGAVWVGNGGGGGANYTVSVSRVDPDSYKVTGTVKLPNKYEGGGGPPSEGVPGIAVGAGVVWAVDPDGTVSRIDPETGRLVATIDVEASPSIAAGKEGVWFLQDGPPSVTRIDPRTNRVAETIPLGASSLYGIAVGAGSVWATAGDEGLVWRIEPGRNPVTRTVPVGVGATFIAFGGGLVWTANFVDGIVSRIDPRTNTVTARVPIGAPQALAAGAGSAWVSTAGGTRAGALLASACGEIESGGRKPDVLIASDLPLQGPFAVAPRAMADAIRFVLKKRGFRAGRYTVGYRSCDDSTARTGFPERRRCAANANAYAIAADLVAVIGPYVSFCAQIEIPILNRAPGGPLALISPSNTYAGLTRSGPGAYGPPDGFRGEPKVYYPTGRGNYVRLAAHDALQGAVHAVLAKRLGLESVYVLHDGFPYGRMVAEAFRRAARKTGVAVAGSETFDPQAKSYSVLADKVARSGAQGVLLGGGAFLGGDRLLKALRARLGKRAPIMAGDDGFTPIPDVLEFVGPAALGLYVSTPDVPPDALKLSPAGLRFARDFGATPPFGTPLTYVLQAGQAAEVALQAIARSDGTRASVLRELRATQVKDGILGSFRFDRNGDITPAPVMILRITGRTPPGVNLYSRFQGAEVDRVIRAPASLAE